MKIDTDVSVRKQICQCEFSIIHEVGQGIAFPNKELRPKKIFASLILCKTLNSERT